MSIEWSRWTRLLDGELAWEYGSGGGKGSAYVEGGKGNSVLVEGFVVELDELLCKGVKNHSLPGQGRVYEARRLGRTYGQWSRNLRGGVLAFNFVKGAVWYGWEVAASGREHVGRLRIEGWRLFLTCHLKESAGEDLDCG